MDMLLILVAVFPLMQEKRLRCGELEVDRYYCAESSNLRRETL
jgi:hypothetical protein